jgi:hypothetical protein
MRKTSIILGITFVLLFSLLLYPCWSAQENLDEVIARQTRQRSSSWGFKYLEDRNNHYIWQPETLCYYDVLTGKEVWKLTASSGVDNTLPDIGFPQWSADGKRFAFVSTRNTRAFFSEYSTEDGIWMDMRADGTYLRPQPNAPTRTAARYGYCHWSPVIPDVYYQFGSNYAGEGLRYNNLYKVTVSETSDSKAILIRFPKARGELCLKKAISADGTKVMATDCLDESWWYPATVFPDESAGLDDRDGYSSDRPTFDDYWGFTGSRIRGMNEYNHYHDQYMAGAGSDIWFYIMPENTEGTWWRTRLTGTEQDGGSRHVSDHTEPYNWGGELEPICSGLNSGKVNRPYCDIGIGPDENCPGYMSHFNVDRWGRYAIFSAVEGPYPIGPGIYDMDKHVWIRDDFHGGAQHHDWHAWSDWSASSNGGESLEEQTIVTQRYDASSSQVTLCSAHIASDTPYHSYFRLARPSQSPDGTKINWHSSFLNNDKDVPDIFYVVAYYPYPPEITSCTASGGVVTVRFDWKLDQKHPRGYTKRGWPDEDNDNPPPPRETAKFRLWRSTDKRGWIPIKKVDADIFSKYDFPTGNRWHPRQTSYWDITDIPGNGAFYYAVTAVEHSGLESQTLSNIYKITLLDGEGKGSENTLYPSNPGGDSGFYTMPPSPPINVLSTHKKRPARANGQYTIEWRQPVNYEMIRYYNIYAEDGAIPKPIQQNRIASIPAGAAVNGSFSWVDCFGNPNGSTRYLVTSVDYQGNESAGLTDRGNKPDTQDRISSPSSLQ